ncbi:MAG: hypothetical protein OXF68_04230 [Gammaproteobacteria bacterium]|nr:hypothetical protein [Gammaproteobacteria bacterium]
MGLFKPERGPILMQRALKDISDMATSLEASGIERHQAAATLEAIANSIEKFAVTPQRLRAILDESQQALYERIREENDQRFDAVDKRFGDVITTIHDLRQQQRSDSVKVFNLMLGIALGMAGVTGGLIFNLLFP